MTSGSCEEARTRLGARGTSMAGCLRSDLTTQLQGQRPRKHRSGQMRMSAAWPAGGLGTTPTLRGQHGPQRQARGAARAGEMPGLELHVVSQGRAALQRQAWVQQRKQRRGLRHRAHWQSPRQQTGGEPL